MDESDEDFRELCASFFQRVRKNGPRDGAGERKRQRATSSARAGGRPQGPRPAAARGRAPAGPAERKGRPGSRAPRVKQPAPPQSPERGPAVPGDREGGEPVPAAAPGSAESAPTEPAPGSDRQAPPSCPAAPSPSTRAAELALQRMQRFKRADPTRLRHDAPPASGAPAAAPEEVCAQEPREGAASQGLGPGLPAPESDTAVAWALQQELGGERAGPSAAGLEEQGLFFCQICQKDLSAMSVARREQHVNRCLDEAETAARPPAPQTPECPICGKPSLTPRSRTSHLKRCAARMEVGPQLLLQAVRLQAALPAEAPRPPAGAPSAPTPAPSRSSLAGGLKREGTASKEPRKRRKVGGPEAACGDLPATLALSRSGLERAAGPGAERRSRRRRAPASPPRLLLQDAETTGRQIEDRVAQLLAEEAEVASTPPLPASGLLRKGLGAAPGRRQDVLWAGSALTQAWAPESFYTASLVPPLVLRRPAQVPTQPPGPPCPRTPSPSASQRERQALQDLLDLAGEGLNASPWPCGGDPASPEGAAGLDASLGSLPPTGFVLPAEAPPPERGSPATLCLGRLAADLAAMVNNPQLSDVQFQTDSGELLHAHTFVLYARCPRLLQHADSAGFSAAEDGDLPARRVLLDGVSSEAARAFLRYLYTADARPAPALAADLASLARRFGVQELAHLCEQALVALDTEGGRQEPEDSRAESFVELLRSVWAREEAEGAEGAERPSSRPGSPEEDGDRVDEAEMEEIYEFAATQRQLLRRGGAQEGGGPGSVRAVAPPATPSGSPRPGREEGPAAGSSEGRPGRPPLGGRCSDGEGAAEAPPGTPRPPSSGGPAGGRRAGREAGASPCPVDADDDERPLPSAPGGRPQTPPVAGPGEEGDGGDGGLGCSPGPPPARLPAQPPPQGPPLAGDSTPPEPRSPCAAATLTPQSAPSPRRRGRPRGSPWGRRGGGAPASPRQLLSIDLTQPRPSRAGDGLPDPPPRLRAEDEVILLLDSDDELELQRAGAAAAAPGPPEGGQLLDVSSRSGELFPVIDVDADQDASQSPPRGAASPQPPKPGSPEAAGLGVAQGSPGLLRGPESSPDEDSGEDSSWLVPATPRAAGSRLSASRTQVPGLRSRPSAGPAVQLQPAAASRQADGPQAAARPPATQPPVPTSGLSSGAPARPDGGRQGRRSPCSPLRRHHGHLSLLDPPPVAGSPPDSPPQHRPRARPGPSPAGRAPAGEVVEVEDSGDELEAAPWLAGSSPLLDSPPLPGDDGCWHAEPLSPIPIDHLSPGRSGPPSATPVRGAGRRRSREKGPRASSPGGDGRPSFLDSALWDDWDGAEEPPAGPHAGSPGAAETPRGAHRRPLPPRLPITPTPRYSLMETPVLKKELDRFGVRPLPKRQMVLKLKEIFQYTHQTLGSGSEDEGPPSPAPQRPRGAQGSPAQKQQPGGGVPVPSTPPAGGPPPGPDGDPALPASQGPADGSDSSLGSSQSSASSQSGPAFESAGDEEGAEAVSASQAAAAGEALGLYIRSQPALYRRVLQYQPLELAELRAGLRQQGVRVAAGRLLDLLDAQCITFTSAAARRDKPSRRRRWRPAGKRKAGGPAPPP